MPLEDPGHQRVPCPHAYIHLGMFEEANTELEEVDLFCRSVQFNLAGYESQLGNIDRAKAQLSRSTQIDAKFGKMALDDPDLGSVLI